MLFEELPIGALPAPDGQATLTSAEHSANHTSSDATVAQSDSKEEAQLMEAKEGDETITNNPYPDAPLNCLSYPQILDTVLEHSDSWIPLRATCRALKERVDTLFCGHIVLRQATREEVTKRRGKQGELFNSVSSQAVITRPERRIPRLLPYWPKTRWDLQWRGTGTTDIFSKTAVVDLTNVVFLRLENGLVLKDLPALKTLRIHPIHPDIRTPRCVSTDSTIPKLVLLPYTNVDHMGPSGFNHSRCPGPLSLVNFVGTVKKTVINIAYSMCCGPSCHHVILYHPSETMSQPQPQTGNTLNVFANASGAAFTSPHVSPTQKEVVYIFRILPSVSNKSIYPKRDRRPPLNFEPHWRNLFSQIVTNLVSGPKPRVKIVGLSKNIHVPRRYSRELLNTEDGLTVSRQMTVGVVDTLNRFSAWHQQQPGAFEAVDIDEALSRLEYLSLDEYDATLEPGELALEMEEVP